MKPQLIVQYENTVSKSVDMRGGDEWIIGLILLFFISCTSSILLSEHCGNAPWTRRKWMLMMVLESAPILWVVL